MSVLTAWMVLTCFTHLSLLGTLRKPPSPQAHDGDVGSTDKSNNHECRQTRVPRVSTFPSDDVTHILPSTLIAVVENTKYSCMLLPSSRHVKRIPIGFCRSASSKEKQLFTADVWPDAAAAHSVFAAEPTRAPHHSLRGVQHSFSGIVRTVLASCLSRLFSSPAVCSFPDPTRSFKE
jgi:hypothetical protein